jgi:hypothetical protein
VATGSLAKITTAANFPEHFMLENLAVRADGSILVVASPGNAVPCRTSELYRMPRVEPG